MMISTVMATTTANMANQNPTVNLLLQIHLMTLHHGHEQMPCREHPWEQWRKDAQQLVQIRPAAKFGA